MGASTAWETPTLPAGQGARAAAAAAPCKGTSGGTAEHGASRERMGTGGATATTPGRAASAGAVQQGCGGANGAPPPPGCSEAFTSRGDVGRSGCSLLAAMRRGHCMGTGEQTPKPWWPGARQGGTACSQPECHGMAMAAGPRARGSCPCPCPHPTRPLPPPASAKRGSASLSPRGRRVLSRVAGAWLPPSRR